MLGLVRALAVTLYGATVLAFPAQEELDLRIARRQSGCTNTASSRDCWSDGFDINTDFYVDTPDTGVTREYWLSVESVDCAPDGVTRSCMTFNGTVPGPLITADWGDTLTIHVTNNLLDNGTAIHWHGLRQLNTVEMDGVPGVTQCPMAPGESMTYTFRVRQYGTTWYHSHFTFQYAEGLFGPLVINGPASDNYDEDLGTIFLQDWSHTPIMTLWGRVQGGTFILDNTLLNGTNTFTHSDGTVTGEKLEVVVEKDKSYRLRLINVAVDGVFDFHIDGHNFTIIATDLVPVKPFMVDHIQINIGQRYDIIVHANADPGDYWIRGGWNTNCRAIGNGGDVSSDSTAILRYDSTSTEDPATDDTTGVISTCFDQDRASLAPVVDISVTNLTSVVTEYVGNTNAIKGYFTWTLNSSTLYLDWANPTLKQVIDGNTSYAVDENVVTVGNGVAANEWVVLVLDSENVNGNHPIHLHGHDFFILAQFNNTVFDGTTNSFNLDSPERRDVALLPQKGYLAIAFQLDNPGTWLVHCHIAWHTSQGLAMQFVESRDSILTSGAIDNWDSTTGVGSGNATCRSWDSYVPIQVHPQDDSGV